MKPESTFCFLTRIANCLYGIDRRAHPFPTAFKCHFTTHWILLCTRILSELCVLWPWSTCLVAGQPTTILISTAGPCFVICRACLPHCPSFSNISWLLRHGYSSRLVLGSACYISHTQVLLRFWLALYCIYRILRAEVTSSQFHMFSPKSSLLRAASLSQVWFWDQFRTQLLPSPVVWGGARPLSPGSNIFEVGILLPVQRWQRIDWEQAHENTGLWAPCLSQRLRTLSSLNSPKRKGKAQSFNFSRLRGYRVEGWHGARVKEPKRWSVC